MAESKEEMDYWRIISLLYKVAPSAVRVTFDKEFHPTNGLEAALKQDKWRVLEPLKRKRIIHQVQWDLLFPISGPVSSTTFDLTLMICLIRHLTPIQIGDIVPQSTDVSSGADLSRLKYYRNKFAHDDGCRLTERDFEIYWSEICQSILRLGGEQFKQICEDVRDMALNNNEKEILLEIRNLEKASSFVPKALQKIHEDLIFEWGEEDNKVVKTRAISRIEELLKDNNVVVAVGSSGCGKSTAIHHVALRLHNQEGYIIVPVHYPEDIIQYCEPKYKQVFVIDDVCGKSVIDVGLVNRWETVSTDIKKIIDDHKIKILISCRKHIYLDRSYKGVALLSETTCDLVSNHSLTHKERNQIALTYLTENEVIAIDKVGLVEKFSFFPLLCCLYSKQKLTGVLNYFANPISVIRSDLDLFRKATNQTTLATMSLFIAFDNSLDENSLSRSHLMTELLEAISDHFYLQARFSIKDVKSELQKLEMSYVKKTVSTYRILHDKIYDIFLLFCGEHFFDLVLEVAHNDVIRDRFVLDSIQNEKQNLAKENTVITVPENEEDHYFARILKEIQNEKGFIKDIFLNRQFKFLTFRSKLFQYLRHALDIKKVFLNVSKVELSNMLLSMTRQCYWDMIPILLTEHVDVNVRDWQGTPLYFASVKGNIDIAKVLLENQADPNIKGWLEKGSQTPLKVAVDNGNVDLVKLLLAHHADTNVTINYFVRQPLLHTALKQKNGSIAKLLLEHKADCNVFDSFGRTPLYATVRQGSHNLTFLLLNHGADPNIGRPGFFMTPLQVAFSKGDIDMIKILLDYKAESNITNEKGETPLFQAVGKNHTNIVKLLLEHNCDPYICNERNKSPLSFACEKGLTNIVKLLLEHNCDPNICNDRNKSPLFIACGRNLTDIVKLLLEHKCDPNICNDRKESPLSIASLGTSL
ncbi:uncharacterized protein LOC143058157 [Mytilus galloprovincialis]|uniref:uncharacterized protein LOC143058157 n=1 Tax=Mytilus galloprovincialis TaxID=29158 RepID=UPI003F7B82C2